MTDLGKVLTRVLTSSVAAIIGSNSLIGVPLIGVPRIGVA